MTTLSHREGVGKRGRVKLSPFSLQHPLPRKCHSAVRQRGDSVGHQAGEGRSWAFGGAMEAEGLAPTVPGRNRIPPPHHRPNSIKALGSRSQGAGPAVGAVAASSLPVLLEGAAGTFSLEVFSDAWASAPKGAPSRTLSTEWLPEGRQTSQGSQRRPSRSHKPGQVGSSALKPRPERSKRAQNPNAWRTAEEPRAALAVPPAPPAVSSHP